jgi:hypothetical protein
MWWAVLFGVFVLRRTDKEPLAPLARGMIVAFAVVSLVGMPTQEVPASITFWLAAFWFVFLVDQPPGAAVASRRNWLPVLVPVAIFAAGTAWMAANTLRVPVRAQRFGWPYSYGFYKPERGIFGPGPGWTGGRAVWVFQAPGEWIALTVSADYRAFTGSRFAGGSGEVLTRPSDVRLWCNGQRLFETRLTTSAPVTKYVRVPDGHRWAFVESSVNGGVPARDLGVDDDWEVGVLLDWTPVQTPPSTDAAVCG